MGFDIKALILDPARIVIGAQITLAGIADHRDQAAALARLGDLGGKRQGAVKVGPGGAAAFAPEHALEPVDGGDGGGVGNGSRQTRIWPLCSHRSGYVM